MDAPAPADTPSDIQSLRAACTQAQRETGIAGSRLHAARKKAAKLREESASPEDIAAVDAEIAENSKELEEAKIAYNVAANALQKRYGGIVRPLKPVTSDQLVQVAEEARLKQFRSILATGAPEVLQKLVDMAKAGDVQAIKVIADKLIPTPKPVEMGVKIDLPGVDRAESVFRAITEGRIGVEAGGRLLQAVAAIEEARANADVAARIAALEAKVAQGPQQPATGSNVIRIPAKAAPREASAWSAGE